jgi:hypothetical protein
MSTTLGIDLASQPENTAICTIEWAGGAAEVTTLLHGRRDRSSLDDPALRAQFGAGHAKVAIDAPLGWPEPFVRALVAHRELDRWPEAPKATLERRCSDRFVIEQTGKRPLSVSTDRIAYCAMRCAVLLSGLDEPRDGSGLVVEAYPDAALRCWLAPSFEARPAPTYKGADAQDRRAVLLAALLSLLGGAFSISQTFQDACVASDDCLDALLCALVARAAERGRTVWPKTDEQRRLAPIEGWIHLPTPDSLSGLCGGR